MNNDEIAEIEDICGQLNDVEGEWQKLVEECIGRLLKLIEKPKDRESIIRNITKHIHTEARG